MNGSEANLERLRARIDPATVPVVNVTGKYWTVYLKTSASNDSTICLGVVMKVEWPEPSLHWKLAVPEAGQDDATMVSWRHRLTEIEESLSEGNEESPSPSVVYGRRKSFQGPSVERVLEILYGTIERDK